MLSYIHTRVKSANVHQRSRKPRVIESQNVMEIELTKRNTDNKYRTLYSIVNPKNWFFRNFRADR